MNHFNKFILQQAKKRKKELDAKIKSINKQLAELDKEKKHLIVKILSLDSPIVEGETRQQSIQKQNK